MYMVFQYIISILCMMSLGLETRDIFLVAFSCIFRMHSEGKIEAPLTPALAPGGFYWEKYGLGLDVD